MVGSVIVHDGQIVGEGYHEVYGSGHAEVNAIRSVKDKSILSECTLYVNLEPCSHFGKTPPCSDLIVESKIPRVVIGTVDTTSKVSGKGIERLKENQIEVIVNVLQKECRELNKRFFTFHEKKRPYIILKWAQSKDSFIDKTRGNAEQKPAQITGEMAQQLVHQWRSEEDSILVGGNTVRQDNPQLNVRKVSGKNPLRIVISSKNNLPEDSLLLIDGQPTLIYTSDVTKTEEAIEYKTLDFNGDWISELLTDLHNRNVQSILIEGGAMIHSAFLENNYWDEIRRFTNFRPLEKGIASPSLWMGPHISKDLNGDLLEVFYND